MVVLKHAMRDGREAASVAKMTLLTNNFATRPMLGMLPDYGPLPAMQHIEQAASAEVLESLTKLADQCAAAQCQPLEVFARSVRCVTHRTAVESIAARGRVYERQQRFRVLAVAMARMEEQLQPPADAIEPVPQTQHERLQQRLEHLALTFLKTLQHLLTHDRQPNTLHRADLDHMLPGRPQRFRGRGFCLSRSCAAHRAEGAGPLQHLSHVTKLSHTLYAFQRQNMALALGCTSSIKWHNELSSPAQRGLSVVMPKQC